MADLYPELLSSNPDAEKTRRKNAKIFLETCCKLKEGETVAIMMGRREGHSGGPNRLDCYALSETAMEMGAYPFIIDLEDLCKTPYFKTDKGLEALSSLVKADVVIGSATFFKRMGFGELESFDKYLIGDLRWMDMQRGLDRWELTAEDIEETKENTLWLQKLLEDAQEIRVTNPAGTDFRCKGMHCRQILGIVPCYGEVAVTPEYGSGEGVIVVEGPTQAKVRPMSETDRQPLIIRGKNGVVTDVEGDPEQVERCRAFIAAGDPEGKFFDEVGVPTTRIESNNACWGDGTHNCYTIHIAIGNNSLRDDLVHGKLHMDMEIKNPTLWIDGKIVMTDCKFIKD